MCGFFLVQFLSCITLSIILLSQMSRRGVYQGSGDFTRKMSSYFDSLL